MSEPSAGLTIAFVLVVLATTIVVLGLVRRAHETSDGEPGTGRSTFNAFFIVGLWMALTAALASSGVLQSFDRCPPPFFILMIVTVVGSVAVAFSRFGTRIMGGVSLAWLTKRTPWLWSILGTGLLLDVLAVAVLSSPTFAFWGPDQLNLWVTMVPFVWLPTVLVPFALIGQLLLWRRLFRDRRLPESPGTSGPLPPGSSPPQ